MPTKDKRRQGARAPACPTRPSRTSPGAKEAGCAPLWLTASVSPDGVVYYAVYCGEPSLDPGGQAWSPGPRGRRVMLFHREDVAVLRAMCARGGAELPRPGEAVRVAGAFNPWPSEED